jgi:serine/threonine-protein kinase
MELAENVVVANRFRLVRMIGRGGMGSVWRAFDQNLNTDCAIKFIEGEHANKNDAHTRFKREAQAAAQLRSPHIVQIFDHNIWEGVPYLAMELLEGEDLGQRLDRLGRLPPADVAILMTQVCRALGKAHERGIIHRDLKPENVFLVRDDDREIAKVLDFGIAKHTSGGFDVATNTKTGSVMGTPFYMSPEQAQGSKTLDATSDLWALAVIAFQCVTGRLPFESEALGDLFVKIIVSPIPMPSSVAPDVSPAFDAWWAKASNRDPSQRFPNAKVFAEALSVALGQPAVPGMRGELSSLPASDSAGYPPAPGSAPAVRVVASGARGAPTMAEGAPAQPLSMTFSGTDIPAGVPKKSNVGLIVGIALGALVLVGGVIGGVIVLRRGSAQATAVPSAEVALSAKNAVASAAPSANTPASDPAASAQAAASAVPSAVLPGAVSTSNATAGAASTTAPSNAALSMAAPKQGGAAKPRPAGGGAQSGGGKPAPKPTAKPDLGF